MKDPSILETGGQTQPGNEAFEAIGKLLGRLCVRYLSHCKSYRAGEHGLASCNLWLVLRTPSQTRRQCNAGAHAIGNST